MAEGFLSQGEVDALLKGVDEDEFAGDASSADPGNVRPYNLATQERIVRGRMPTLEIINERFTRLFRIGLFNFLRRTTEISAGPLRTCKYSEFVRNLVVPTNLNLVQIKPLRGTSLVVFDPTLVFSMVDSMFGGDGRFHTRVEGRDFTQTEQRIIQRVLEIVFESYSKSWAPVYGIEFEYIRSEMNTQFANIATPNEVVVAMSYTIEIGTASGEMHICIPYASIEPIRDLLTSPLQGEALGIDKRWVKLLTQQIQIAEIELVANLGSRDISLREVMEMKVGDVIPLTMPTEIEVSVDNVPVVSCRYGTFNGQYALRVEKFLKADSMEYIREHKNDDKR
jgi:flagellar motor switch protein FliM